MKKLDILFILFTLLLSISVVSNVSAGRSRKQRCRGRGESDCGRREDIPLYNEISDEEPELVIPADTAVILLDRMEDYSKVRYIENEDNSVEGYVETKHIAELEQSNDQTKNNEEKESENNEPVKKNKKSFQKMISKILKRHLQTRGAMLIWQLPSL